jgi:DNA-binding response OmpR family regulator
MRDHGLTPLEASSGEDALQILEQNPIDLVLLDIELPGIDGLEMLRKAKLRDSGLPVIVITGRGSISIAVDALKRGAEDFLTKPFKTKDLIATITTPLRRRLAWRAQTAATGKSDSTISTASVAASFALQETRTAILE